MTTLINIPKMLQYWGTPFVTILYRCFLNREPDPEGLKYYLGRLEQGIDRLTIIEQMLKSAEAKSHFTSKDIILIQIEIKRLQFLQLPGKLPILEAFSSSFPKKQRILLNTLNELQFQIQKPDIANSSEFAGTPSFLAQKIKFNRTKKSKLLALNDNEHTLFKKIYKQL